jgi:ATP-binding cassette, subfamily C (CFTR/MRP), member 1
LKIQDGEFQWGDEEAEPTLHGIDLTVKKGELVGVLGRVGAGKVRNISHWSWHAVMQIGF